MREAERAGWQALPDEDLIARVLHGERAAFDGLYERYFARVYSFAQRRLRNRADTEETVQEVFFNVFASLASYRGDAPFAAWVLGVTRRTLASRFKKKRHSMVPLESPDEADAALPAHSREPTPHEHYECGERIAQLAARVEQELSAEQRTLFELHHLQHHPIQEIARTLCKSEDAVKSNLYRARKTLLAR
jgi:RNA polymerase sigma-70 factor (ECF subfamily)